MTDPAYQPAIPDLAEREALNAALLADGTETGFWDSHGRPAPWPDDIDDWTAELANHAAPGPGHPPSDLGS